MPICYPSREFFQKYSIDSNDDLVVTGAAHIY